MIAPGENANFINNSSKLRQRIWRYAPLVTWLALIFFASTSELSASKTSLIVRPLLLWLFPHISEEQIGFAHFMIRKAAHFTEYGILALLAVRAFIGSSQGLLRRRWFWVTLLLIVLYALSDEFHQSFVPSRTASIYDSLIDMAGGLTALTFCVLWQRRSAGLNINAHSNV